MEEPVLQTKLGIPIPWTVPAATSRTSLIPRPQLIERLNEGLSGRLTLVCVPAGFGKTTLISNWLQQVNLPSAWLSLMINYYILVFVLSIPIWLISSLLGNQLPVPMNLPISAFLFVCPVIAASILEYQRDGLKGVKELLKKTFDAKKIKNKIWYVPILVLVPSIYLLTYIAMRLLGLPLPDPIQIPFLLIPVFFSVYFIAAACEELGWSGYAIDPLQDRWGAFLAAIILGLIWQIWHVIGDLQANNTAYWIFWHSLYSVALRVLIVWTYNNTGQSVFAAILVHTMDNVSWSLFPNYGSGLDPFVLCVIAWLTVVIVVVGWGTRTLSRYRFAYEG